MKKQIIIMDMDDVLVNIDEEMLFRMKSNWRKYNRWLENPGKISEKEIYERNDFCLDDWLLKKEVKELPEKEKLVIVKKIKERIGNDCLSFDIYKELKPTIFAERTLMNPLYINSEEIKKIFILTRYFSEEQLEGKRKFIKKYFNNPKIELIPVEKDEKKSEKIKNLGIDWDLFVDDEIKNIQDFVENFDIKKKEFLIPRYGYNKMPLSLSVSIHEKEGSFTYYDAPFKIKDE